MIFTPSRINFWSFLKLPSVWWCGIRVTRFESDLCEAKVKHSWINQNPFKSMFWAVQGMAAELTTGTLIMNEIQKSKHNISMLVLNNKANFSKKATGKITFLCSPKEELRNIFSELIRSKKPQTIWLKSIGINQNKDIVSTFEFEWTLLIKN